MTPRRGGGGRPLQESQPGFVAFPDIKFEMKVVPGAVDPGLGSAG